MGGEGSEKLRVRGFAPTHLLQGQILGGVRSDEPIVIDPQPLQGGARSVGVGEGSFPRGAIPVVRGATHTAALNVTHGRYALASNQLSVTDDTAAYQARVCPCCAAAAPLKQCNSCTA